MSTKRKSLSADVMQQFIKDPDAVSNSANTELLAEVNNSKLMSKNAEVSTDPLDSSEETSLTADVIEMFKSNQKEATTRFTVDLPKSRHQRFAIVSKQLNTNMSSLARVLIEKFLDEIERDKLL
ncbi:hypothetical protein [Chamaesiphon sp.]|uniref:hypothetical protein n=1 Tax=Chamaesiphon sp. TaxID=2814140 RepID=UPI00359438E2